MINSCVGGVIHQVMAHHALPGNWAEVPRETYLPRWTAGGLTGAVVQVSSWQSIAVGLAERGLSQADIDMVTGESYLRMLDRARPSAPLVAVDAVGADRVSP